MQQRIVETAPSEAQAGGTRFCAGFAERVEEQTAEGTATTIPQSTSSSSNSSPTTIATSMQVDESDQDRSKRQKVVHGTGMELEGLVMEAEFNRLQRYSDRSFLVQAMQDTDSYLDKIVSKDCMERERSCEEGLVTVRCAFVSSRGRSVFKSWKTCFVHRLGLTLGLALDLRTGWDLHDLGQRAKMWLRLQRERPNFNVGSWSGLGTRTTHMRWMIDVYCWQVSQGRFFVHQESGHLPVNSELCAMKSVLVSRVDWWRTFSRTVKKYTTISPS